MRPSRQMRFSQVVRAGCVFLLLASAPPLPAQEPELPNPLTEPGKVLVRVRTLDGALPNAQVRLFTRTRADEIPPLSQDAAVVIFENVPAGSYFVEATAAGYKTAREEIEVIPRAVIQAMVLLQPEAAPGSAAAPGPPLLAPNARKEVEKALEALRDKNPAKARARLEKALRMAPGHPEVHYLLGVLALDEQNAEAARAHFEKAVRLYPDHARAQAALGRLYYQQRNHAAAIVALERSLSLNAWVNHALLASAYYRERQFEKCRDHARRALELAQGKAPQVRILLAQAMAALGEREKAVGELESFLSHHPEHAKAPEARELLEEFRESGTAGSHEPGRAHIALTSDSVPDVSSPAEPPAAASAWSPPDVDATRPTLIPGVTCSLGEVLPEIRRRVQSLAENMQNIAANEQIEHTEFDGGGAVKGKHTLKFDYLFSTRMVREDLLTVEEWRTGPVHYEWMPTRLLATGLASMALIFHPAYAEDFELRCEGLGQWEGQPAWLIYFRQRSDRPVRYRVYKTKEGRFPTPLKGRAWVAANLHQIVRLEANLIAPIPEARLEAEHLAIEYAPVEFPARKLRLWLPRSAQVHTHFRGRRYLMRHTYSDFTHFAVDLRQKIHEPAPPEKPGV